MQFDQAKALTTPKSGTARAVPMAPQVAGVLALLGQRDASTGEDDLVFAGEDGLHLDGSALRRRYADLTGMPTALFTCGTLDPLLDDTLFMAARWQAAGSPAEPALYQGAPHEFLNLRGAILAARGNSLACPTHHVLSGPE
jgi:acetyl esterase/lipase